jgi:hypothetical protein
MHLAMTNGDDTAEQVTTMLSKTNTPGIPLRRLTMHCATQRRTSLVLITDTAQNTTSLALALSANRQSTLKVSFSEQRPLPRPTGCDSKLPLDCSARPVSVPLAIERKLAVRSVVHAKRDGLRQYPRATNASTLITIFTVANAHARLLN